MVLKKLRCEVRWWRCRYCRCFTVPDTGWALNSGEQEKEKEGNPRLSTSWGEVHNTDTGCFFSLSWYVIRNQSKLHPEGSWRYVKWEGKERKSAERQRWEHGRPGVLCCTDTLPENLSPVVQCLAQRALGTHSSAGCQNTAVWPTWQSDHCEECSQSTMAAFCSIHFHTAVCFQHTLTRQNRNTQCAIWCISPNQLTGLKIDTLFIPGRKFMSQQKYTKRKTLNKQKCRKSTPRFSHVKFQEPSWSPNVIPFWFNAGIILD